MITNGLVDGRAIASDIVAKAKRDIASLGRELVVRAVVMSPTGATDSYLRMKSARAEDAGMRMEVVRIADDATDQDVMAAVQAPGADAVIVQLPLPPSITTSLILDEIPLEKDADVLSRAAYENFTYQKEGAILPPVVAAIKEVLARGGVEIAGKRAVILGSGKLVGQPAAVWLEEMGADIAVLTRKSESLAELAHADIVILGAGSPHLVKPDMLKKGVVLIDAGTSESSGAIVGDADPACAEVASLFTPVPGGMGPIAVACLFQNAAELALRNSLGAV
jgi:methylenetetrahydrofolate dehydrogenase (NADP+)/methenyltetrahydrofolate cyclohydrolase